MEKFDVIIIGAGAAGLMCAVTSAQRGKHVLIVDHANKMGKKILLSGGGRCNFTNRHTTDKNYLSDNRHFCKSALKRYTADDFENLVAAFQIPYHEKTLGQLFCDKSSKDIVQMFINMLQDNDITLKLNNSVSVEQTEQGFIVKSTEASYVAPSLVVATGGLSFPTMGASPFGYQIAEQFGLQVTPVKAALVPLTLHKADLEQFAELSGVSLPVEVSAVCGQSFREAMLFTHRGLSGPAILQISSYWQPGESIYINLLPDHQIADLIENYVAEQPNKTLKQLLSQLLPQRFVNLLCEHYLGHKLIKQYDHAEIKQIIETLECFEVRPNGTEGYRTAEVTLGGVDTDEISSKTFECKKVPGLYFIGEVLDVTGHLGGFNFQWAWSSGYCCGLYV